MEVTFWKTKPFFGPQPNTESVLARAVDGRLAGDGPPSFGVESDEIALNRLTLRSEALFTPRNRRELAFDMAEE